MFGATVDERDVGFRTKVASVLDDDAYFPALTVSEHLYLTARGHGVHGAQDVVAGLLAEFGLADHAKSLPVALSSGQRRRLLLAAGFVRPRSLLVLDEPEQRLDRAMRDRLAARIVAEKKSGGAVLLATHDPDLLRAVADRAVHVADDVTRVLPDRPGGRPHRAGEPVTDAVDAHGDEPAVQPFEVGEVPSAQEHPPVHRPGRERPRRREHRRRCCPASTTR